MHRLPSPGKRFRGTMAALLLVASAAEADMPPASVRLLCDDAPEPYCSALASALSSRTPSPVETDKAEGGAEPDLTIELRMLELSQSRASARLAWWHPGGEEILGPEVSIRVMDGHLPARAPADLVRGLLRMTELPL